MPRFSGSVLVALIAIIACSDAHARENTYQIVDLGIFASAQAINSSGEVTGWLRNGEGFVREPDGTINDFAIQAGCGDVTPWAINDSGTIAGWAYIGSSCSDTVGFLRAKDGTITTVSGLAGWQYIALCSIDAKGVVVGLYGDSTGQHAFVRSLDGALTPFTQLGDVEVFSIASSSNGTIAGSYYDPISDKYLGFLQRTDGSLTTFHDPEHIGVPFAVAVNNDGWITGWNKASRPGFIRRPSGRFSILLKGSPISINSSSVAAGFIRKSAFVRLKNGKSTVLHMPERDDFVGWTAINDSGVVTGSFCEKEECDFQEMQSFIAYPAN